MNTQIEDFLETNTKRTPQKMGRHKLQKEKRKGDKVYKDKHTKGTVFKDTSYKTITEVGAFFMLQY